MTYIATDAAGNADTASFTITVSDAEAPTLANMPANITQTADAGVCSAAVTWTAPTGADNCGAPTVTSTHSPGAAFAVGTTTVTYTATDGAGNTTTGSFNITVTDDEDPAISGMPANITQDTDAGVCTAAVSWTEPTASDNCAVSTFTSTHSSGDAFSLGTTTVTYTATDIHGNTTSSTFNVTVEDNEDPTITGTADITAYTGSGGAPAASGTCTGGADESLTPSSGTLAWELVYDAATGDVTIRPYDSDTNAPWDGNADLVGFQFVHVGNVIPNNNTIINAGWDFYSNSDTCMAYAIFSFLGLPQVYTYDTPLYLPGLMQPGLSEADMADFNTQPAPSTCDPPTGTPNAFTFCSDGIDCPAGRIVYCGAAAPAGGCSADVTWTAPTATDNCTLASLTGTHNSGSTFELGTTTVTYSAIDGEGNVATASFDVTVLDTISPTISGMPADISQSVDTDSCNAVVTWTPPTADDNCALDTFIGSHSPGDTFNNGATTVTYTATDSSGNVTTSSFTVSVTLTESPTISGVPADISVSSDAGICGAAVTWTCLLYTSPSPRDRQKSRMPSSA